MIKIPTAIAKRLPYVCPVVSDVGLAMDVKNIVESATPVGATKIIVKRVLNKCTSPKLLFAGKCIMLGGGTVAVFATGGNPLIVSAVLSAFRFIIQK